VAVVVVGCRLEADEIHEPRHAVRSEVVVPGGDARVDDRDADAGAVEAQGLADEGGADRGARALERAADTAVQADPGHAGQFREGLERGIGHVGDLRADRGEPAARGPADAANERIAADARVQPDDDARVPARRKRTEAQLTIELATVSARRHCRPSTRRQQDAEGKKPSNHFAGYRRPASPKRLPTCKPAAVGPGVDACSQHASFLQLATPSPPAAIAPATTKHADSVQVQDTSVEKRG
jgi:hypothetical protein